jgi:hypothetical protein
MKFSMSVEVPYSSSLWYLVGCQGFGFGSFGGGIGGCSLAFDEVSAFPPVTESITAFRAASALSNGFLHPVALAFAVAVGALVGFVDVAGARGTGLEIEFLIDLSA